MESEYYSPMKGLVIRRQDIDNTIAVFYLKIEDGINKNNFDQVLNIIRQILDIIVQQEIQISFVIDLTSYKKKCMKMAKMLVNFLQNNKSIIQQYCKANVILVKKSLLMNFVQTIFTVLYTPVAPLYISHKPEELLLFMSNNDIHLENIGNVFNEETQDDEKECCEEI